MGNRRPVPTELKVLSWLGVVWDLNEVPDRVRLKASAR